MKNWGETWEAWQAVREEARRLAQVREEQKHRIWLKERKGKAIMYLSFAFWFVLLVKQCTT